VQVNLSANTDLTSVDEFKRLVVREQGGALVRLEDIADVVLGSGSYDSEVRFSGQTAVFMGIWPLPNANSLDVIKAMRQEMTAITRTLPSGLTGQVAYDATKYIDNAIGEVTETLAITLVIVAAIIFLFLGSLRSALIPMVAIPLALVGGTVSHAAVRFYHQSVDLAGHRTGRGSGGGRRHRHGRKRRTPLADGQNTG
jgi:multidrug efflux pump